VEKTIKTARENLRENVAITKDFKMLSYNSYYIDFSSNIFTDSMPVKTTKSRIVMLYFYDLTELFLIFDLTSGKTIKFNTNELPNDEKTKSKILDFSTIKQIINNSN
jgi:hypothetical protein